MLGMFLAMFVYGNKSVPLVNMLFVCSEMEL